MSKSTEFFCDGNVKQKDDVTYCIRIFEGEIIYASKFKYRDNKPVVCFHYDASARSITSCRLIKKILQYFYQENRSDFIKIFKSLNLNTRSYKIAKELVVEKHKEVLKEKEQLESIIFS